MDADEAEAKALLNEVHVAWTEGDLEGTLRCYCDDLVYVCDTGGIFGAPLVISGKNQFKDFLQPIMDAVDSTSAIEHFQFGSDYASAFVSCALTHRITGLKLLGTYTQIVKLRGCKISKLFEIHGVARMACFWRLVLSEEEAPGARWFRSIGLGSKRTAEWRDQLPRPWPKSR